MNHYTLIYNQPYCFRVKAGRVAPSSAVRLVVVSYQPNEAARDILRLCLDSIRLFTREPYELWVVDNCSPPHLASWLGNEDGLNVVFNLTPPVPPRSLLSYLRRRWSPPYAGSYANAVALELAAQVIDPKTELLMTLHMDTMVCRQGWLDFLCNKLDGEVRCVGVRMDRARAEVVHVLGMLFDFTLYRALKLTFAHNLPQYDVGDGISLKLREVGYQLWACRNTLHQPELVNLLPVESPFRDIHADRALDDDGNVIFMHLGRGILRSQGCGLEADIVAEEWLRLGRELLLTQGGSTIET